MYFKMRMNISKIILNIKKLYFIKCRKAILCESMIPINMSFQIHQINRKIVQADQRCIDDLLSVNFLTIGLR